MQPIEYSSDELIRTFSVLLQSYDLERELAFLGIGRFQFTKRKKARRELTALFIALWGLALQKSFPSEHLLVYEEFLSRYPYTAKGSNKNVELLLRSVEVYTTLLDKHKDKDFSEVAEFLTGVLPVETPEKEKARLKMALGIRAMYRLIFDRLI